MKFIKRLDTLLTDIAYQLKRNANETEKQSELLSKFNNDGIGKLKIDATGNSLINKFGTVEDCLKERPTAAKTQEMIEKEIKYQDELKQIQEKYPAMLDLITAITTNYANMDKYNILDTVRMFSDKYNVLYK